MKNRELELKEKQIEVDKFCQERGFKTLSPYIKACEKINMLCPVGHEFKVAWSIFRITPSCKFCSRKVQGERLRRTKEELVNGYTKVGLTLLNPESYVRAAIKMDVSCNQCNSLFKISWNKVSQGSSCPKCSRKRTSEKQKMDINYIRSFMFDHGDTLLSKVYVRAKEKLNILCKNDHAYECSWDSYKRNPSGCPKCRRFLNEEECREIFEQIFWDYFPKARPEWLVNHETGKRMELDGYNERLKIAFEYDGEQHFRPIKNWGDADIFQKVKKRDELKEKLCLENGITLIRIPYFSKNKLKRISTIIREKIPQKENNTAIGALARLVAEKTIKEEQHLYEINPKQ